MSSSATIDEARAAKSSLLKSLEGVPGLAGIGIMASGTGFGVKVNFRDAVPASMTLPLHIGKVPILVEIIGVVTKRLTSAEAPAES